MTELFRDSGFEKTASTVSSSGSSEIIAAPGEGKHIYLLGANASGLVTLKKTNNDGAIIVYISQGNSNFPATVKVAENTAVYANTLASFTLFYYIA